MSWMINYGLASSAAAGMIALAGDLAGTGSAALTPRVGTLTGVAGVVAVRDGAALAFIADETVTGIATTGDLRFRNNRTIIAARNALDSADIPIITTDTSNNVIYDTGTLHSWRTAGVTKMSLSSTVLTMTDGMYIALSSGTIAATGDIRAKNATTIISARNAANTDNIICLSTDSSNNVIFGASTVNPYVVFRSASSVDFQLGGLSVIGISSNTLAFGQSQSAPSLNQTSRTTNDSTANLTIAPQAPYASATGTNRNSGTLVLSIAAPAAGGTYGSTSIRFNSTERFGFGFDGTNGTLALHTATASSATGGAATALPALPVEYATITYRGNVRKFPLYAA